MFPVAIQYTLESKGAKSTEREEPKEQEVEIILVDFMTNFIV